MLSPAGGAEKHPTAHKAADFLLDFRIQVWGGIWYQRTVYIRCDQFNHPLLSSFHVMKEHFGRLNDRIRMVLLQFLSAAEPPEHAYGKQPRRLSGLHVHA